MKNVIFFFLITSSMSMQGQKAASSLVAPYIKSCGGELALESTPQCTDSIILDLLYAEIDSSACPEIDSIQQYILSLTISENGALNDLRLTSHIEENECQDYLSSKLESALKRIRFNPGVKEHAFGEYFKSLRFKFPEDTTTQFDFVVDSIYGFPDEPPRFNACEAMVGNAWDKKRCADSKMLQFMYKTLRYPAEARNKGIEGMAVVQFIIDENGDIIDPQVIKDPGGGCGQASLDVLIEMAHLDQPFSPGILKGIPVKSMYTLPFRFKLR